MINLTVRITSGQGTSRVTGRRRTFRVHRVTIVPRWLAQEGVAGRYAAVNREAAEWVLVDVTTYDPTYAGLLTVADRGASRRVLVVPFAAIGVTCHYLHVETEIASLKPWARRALVYMQAPELLPHYGACSQTCLLRSALEATHGLDYSTTVARGVLEVLAGKVKLPHHIISQQHLRHVTPTMLHDIVRSDPAKLPRLAALNKLLTWGPDLSETTFTTIGLYLCLLPEEHYLLIRPSALWTREMGMREWYKLAKEISVRLKSLQHIVDIDCTPLFEMDVLLNRGVGEVDWAAERTHRTEGIQVTKHTYEEIYQTAAVMFRKSRAEGRRPTRLRWDAFWKRRWEWATPGAVHSQHAADTPYIPTRGDYKTKWHTLSAMPRLDITRWLSRKPQMVAWPSTKYEWGKQRAIYGVDLTNYVLATYGYAGAEGVMPESCPLGTHVNADTVRARVRATTAGLSPYCLDFDDFNSQHSTTSMAAVLQAYIDSYRDDLEDEQRAACAWVVAALSDMRVMAVTPRQTAYRAVGTLLSGWRLTTFVNTVLNYCYLEIAKGEERIPTLHSGDDVLAGVASFSQARKLECALIAKGCRLQASKCFLGGLCEFLRIDHSAVGSGQYLARATSTAVHAPVETRKPYMMSAVLEAAQTRLAELEARQADRKTYEALRRAYIAKISRLWDVDVATIEDIMATHRAFGGLSLARDAHIEKFYVNAPVHTKAEDVTQVVTPGASDYAWELCHSLLVEQFYPDVRRQAQRALNVVAGETVYTVRAAPVPDWVTDPPVLRARYGCNRTQTGHAPIKLLAGMGLPIMALDRALPSVTEHYRQYPAEHRLAWMAVTV